MKLPFYRKVCKIVVLTMLMSVGYSALMHAGINTPSTGSVVNPFGSTISPLSAKYDGTNLYIAANDGTGTEMCYWFKKCMKNNLFTFFKVGQRTVNRISSDTEGISKSTGITWLNSTSSDNIGPVQIDGYGDFVGGNHMWRDADENGNPGAATYTDTLGKKYVLYTDICTAICDSVKVSIDGSEMPVGTVVYGQHVEVKVWNTLFDPLVVPNEGDEVLTSPLIGEFVTYTVTGGSIAVDVRHDYKKSVTVRTYYGMQSMFVKEDSIMTPGGKHATFTVESAATKFNKNDYPFFSRYIEHNANGWCQSAWMRPIDLGAHNAIAPNSNIYKRATGTGSSAKCYHVIIDNYPVSAGDTLRWHGIYTWALPVINDVDLLVYKGIIDGKEALYIDAKRPCDRVIAMAGASMLRITDYAQNSQGATISINDSSIHISTTQPASYILVTKTNGDVNADGRVDVEDVNAMINLILFYEQYKNLYSGNADLDGSGKVDVEDVNALINIILSK